MEFVFFLSHSFLPKLKQHQSSNDAKVMLKRLNLKSSGIYRCEISAEAPNFSSVEGEGRMEVVCKCSQWFYLTLIQTKNKYKHSERLENRRNSFFPHFSFRIVEYPKFCIRCMLANPIVMAVGRSGQYWSDFMYFNKQELGAQQMFSSIHNNNRKGLHLAVQNVFGFSRKVDEKNLCKIYAQAIDGQVLRNIFLFSGTKT